jgi:hypothetical protein
MGFAPRKSVVVVGQSTRYESIRRPEEAQERRESRRILDSDAMSVTPFRENECMEIGRVDQIINDLQQVDFTTSSAHAAVAFLSRVQKLRGVIDGVEVHAARRLHELSVTAPADLAAATQRHHRAGEKVFERSATLASLRCLSDALSEGTLQGEHVDTVTRVLRTVPEKHAGAFRQALPKIIESSAANRATPDEFARRLNRAARSIENDGGESRYEQQRRDTALRTWTDKRNGMFRISGQFDPKSGALLNSRLQGVVSALFAEKTPTTCPKDAGLKQDHLRALALLALTLGDGGWAARPPSDDSDDHGRSNGDDYDNDATQNAQCDNNIADEWAPLFNDGPSRFGRPEIVIVLDARRETVEANNGQAVVDWGIPVELPARTLAELFPHADIRPIVIANGVVVHAPGDMNLGRTTRLASRAQRRALRAQYPTCAVPGCRVAFEFTKPHHVHYWEHGGPTDLDKLLPLCSKHHHCAHEGGWRLSLQPDRTLTITLPDGAIRTTGPPRRLQAA